MHGQQVFTLPVHKVCDLHRKAGIAAPVLPGNPAVDPHHCLMGGSVKAEEQPGRSLYRRHHDFHYVIPPEIEAIPEAKAAFLESMDEDAKRYLDLAKKLEDGHTARLMAEGMPEKQARAKASKQANEDARFVLPNACETKMVVTMNARSLQNFFHLRCCSRAQWEIRQLAEEMFRLVYPVAPHIFAKAGPACVSGPCPEGKMCCGRTAEVRAKYEAIKQEAGV